MARYFNIDDIMMEEEGISVIVLIGAHGVGLLDPSSETNNVEKGAKVDLPFWLAHELFLRQAVSINFPACFNQKTRKEIQADAACVDLKSRCPYFYELGCKICPLQYWCLLLPIRYIPDLWRTSILAKPEIRNLKRLIELGDFVQYIKWALLELYEDSKVGLIILCKRYYVVHLQLHMSYTSILPCIFDARVGDKSLGPFLRDSFTSRYKDILSKSHSAPVGTVSKFLTRLTKEELQMFEAARSSMADFKKWRVGKCRLERASILGRKRRTTFSEAPSSS